MNRKQRKGERMKRKISVVLVLLFIGLVVWGCGSAEENPTVPAINGTEEAVVPPEPLETTDVVETEREPTRDTVNLAVNATLNSADGHGPKVLQDLLTRAQLYEGLFYYNESIGKIENRLAESFELSEDQTEYIFHLRTDVKFHNGDPLKASDVVFSFTRAKEMAGTKAFVAAVESVEAIDDHAVKVKLVGPNAPFMTNICSVYVLSEREVKEQGEAFGTKVHKAGTGPYYLEELDMAVGWKLRAFPDYWRGEASIKEINYTVITDSSAGLIALESGELDWYDAPIANWDALVANPNFSTEIMPANHITYFAINPKANEALANDLVRKAIAYAVDKEAMNLAAFNGLAAAADFLEHPTFNLGAPSEGLVYSYNPEKAMELLESAGYPNGVDVGTIICFTGSHFEKVAQILQANLAAVGIEAKLEWVDQTTNTTRARAQDYDIVVSGTSPTGDFDHIRLMFHADYVGSKMIALEENPDKFDYQRMADLIDISSATLDPVERIKVDQELNDMIMDTATIIPVLHKVHAYVWDKNLNVVNMPTNYQVYDWSWN